MATEVAYYTYMYAKVPKEYYQQVTGHTRAGILIGRFLSGLIGQLLISFEVMNVKTLTYLSLGGKVMIKNNFILNIKSDQILNLIKYF